MNVDDDWQTTSKLSTTLFIPVSSADPSSDSAQEYVVLNAKVG